MSPDDRKSASRKDFWLAAAIITAGLVLSALSATQLSARNSLIAQPVQTAQATQPMQSSPSAPNNAPAESKPGGVRPTTPAPEPAQPDAASQTTGAAPALPPAPAEKIAPPIKEK
jgi:hypothetical protein